MARLSADSAPAPARHSVPIRSGAPAVAASGPATGSAGAAAPRPDSKFGGQVRSGKDYYDNWDKFTKDELRKMDEGDGRPPLVEEVGAGAAAGAAAVNKAASGPAYTAALREANAGASEVERRWLAERQKEKGNECFKAGELAAAVEAYTLSLELAPGAAAVHANRAAAYLKLRRWDDAEADATFALELQPGYFKALLRRGAARVELGRHREALGDLEAALAADPASAQAAALRDRALRKLGRSQARKLAIEEADDDGSDSDSDAGGEEVPARDPAAGRAAFEAADAYAGPRPGKVFQRGPYGVGYYPDPAAPAAGEPAQGTAGAAPAPPAGAAPGPPAGEPAQGTDGAAPAPPAREPAQGTDGAAPAPPAGEPAEGSDDEDPAAEPLPPKPENPDEVAGALKEEGNAAYAAGDMDGAVAKFTAGLAAGSANDTRLLAVLFSNRSMAHYRAGRFDEAERDASAAAAVDASFAKALLRRGRARVALGHPAAGLADLRAAAAQGVAGAAEAVAEALAEQRRARAPPPPQKSSKNSYKKGKVVIEEVEEAAPETPEEPPMDAAAVAWARGRDLEGARAAAQQLDGGIQRMQAFSAALEEWKRAAQRDLDREEARLARRRGEVDRAVRLAQEEAAAGDAAVGDAVGDAEGGAGDARAESERLKEEGNAKFRAGDSWGAREAFTQALELWPGNVAALSNRAMAELRLKRYASAAQDCDAVLAIEPGHVKALHRRAQAREGEEDWAGALEDYRRVDRALGGKNAGVKAKVGEMETAVVIWSRGSDGAGASSAEPARAEEPAAAAPAAAAAMPGYVAAEVAPGDGRKVAIAIDESDEEEEEVVEEPAPAAPSAPAAPAAPAEEGAPPAEDARTAGELKEEGTRLFKEGDLAGAEAAFSASLDKDGSVSVVWSNRALVRLRAGDAAGAERDCCQALKLDMGNTKALHRRGLARHRLGRLSEALTDLQQVSDRMPDSRVAADLKALRDDMAAPPPKAAAPAKEAAAPAKEAAAPAKEGVSPAKEDAAPAKEDASPAARTSAAAEAAVRAARAAAAASPIGKPKSALEFERACKALQADPAALGKWVGEHVVGESLPGLFKQSLTPKCVLGVATAAGEMAAGRAAEGAALLRGLVEVPRFSMNAMLLSRAEKAVVRGALEALGAAGADVSGLASEYKV